MKLFKFILVVSGFCQINCNFLTTQNINEEPNRWRKVSHEIKPTMLNTETNEKGKIAVIIVDTLTKHDATSFVKEIEEVENVVINSVIVNQVGKFERVTPDYLIFLDDHHDLMVS